MNGRRERGGSQKKSGGAMCGRLEIISQTPFRCCVAIRGCCQATATFRGFLCALTRSPCVGAGCVLTARPSSFWSLTRVSWSGGARARHPGWQEEGGEGSKVIPAHPAESLCCDAARGVQRWACCTWGKHSAPPATSPNTCNNKQRNP